ncbi:MAG: biotin transporter BioY [Oscillospiraceae bacterium]|nr:biotin transporter BioY [Oscillospiraceae bacterium]
MNINALVRCGLVSALIAVTSWISVPFAVPFTMQTFGVFCALLILGGKLGTISVTVYVLLGAVGLPVFAGFQGGMGVIFSPLGGFIIGFIVMGGVYFLITKNFGDKSRVQLAALAVGLLTCYISGTVWYIFFSNDTALLTAVTTCVLPFIIPDAIKLWLAFIVSQRIKQADKKT